jgi:hypothetical protein
MIRLIAAGNYNNFTRFLANRARHFVVDRTPVSYNRMLYERLEGLAAPCDLLAQW